MTQIGFEIKRGAKKSPAGLFSGLARWVGTNLVGPDKSQPVPDRGHGGFPKNACPCPQSIDQVAE
jgi:hypothetical protein